jgi:uncharacterized protein (UPF0548 family)
MALPIVSGGPFRLTRPSARELDAVLAAQRDAPFTYPEVGATRGPAAAGYTIDRNRVRLGAGARTWARAVDALRHWRMTALGWASIHPPRAALAVGTPVAMVVRHYGFWSVHACRIVYTIDEVTEADDGRVHRFGFAYGTLPAHAASGEERFEVSWRRADDSVWYDLLAHSRPRHPLARLGGPLARWQQRRFGRDSKRAMQHAVRDVVGHAVPHAERDPGAGPPRG